MSAIYEINISILKLNACTNVVFTSCNKNTMKCGKEEIKRLKCCLCLIRTFGKIIYKQHKEIKKNVDIYRRKQK
jgi:hypothetical protein